MKGSDHQNRTRGGCHMPPNNMIQLWAQEKLFPLFNVSIFFLPENVI